MTDQTARVQQETRDRLAAQRTETATVARRHREALAAHYERERQERA